MASAGGAAVQVRRIGGAWQDREPGLLILPDEVVQYDGERMRSARRPVPAAAVVS